MDTDKRQIENNMLPIGRATLASDFAQTLSNDDKMVLSSIVMKMQNQSPAKAEKLFNKIDAGEFNNMVEIRAYVTSPSMPSYIVSGQKEVIAGAEFSNRLSHLAVNVGADWKEVSSNRDVYATDTQTPHAKLFKQLFAQTGSSSLSQALDVLESHQNNKEFAKITTSPTEKILMCTVKVMVHCLFVTMSMVL